MAWSRLDLNDVRLLMKVVEHRSFTAASKIIGIPKSTLSQRIAALEDAVGTALLRRNSRSLSLTEAGEVLLPHARAIEETARDAETALLDRGRELAGTLRVTTSFALSQFALAPLMPKFLRRHPNVAVQMSVTNRYADLIGEGYDMGVRAHGEPLQDSGLIQRVIARTPWSLFAAPGWVADNGPIHSPDDITGKDVLFWTVDAERPSWTLHKGDSRSTILFEPRMATADMATLRATAIVGGGVTALPHYICLAALEAGDLVHVLPGWHVLTSSISILMPSRRHTARLTRAFSDYLAEEVAPLAAKTLRLAP